MSRFRLEFGSWGCGHHQARPEPIDDIASPEQALAICRAIGAAISQPGSAHAYLVDYTTHKFLTYYLTDDHASTQSSDWRDRPTLFCGMADANDRRAIDALTWHLLLPDDVAVAWDGKHGLWGGQSGTTTLPLAEASKLVNPDGHGPLRVVEVTAELLAAALEDAIDNEIVPRYAEPSENEAFEEGRADMEAGRFSCAWSQGSAERAAYLAGRESAK